MRTLAGWCVRHRRLVVLLWIAVLVVSIFAVKSVGTAYSDNFNFPHTQSFDAINLLKSVAPAHSGDTEQVVFGTADGTSLTDPAVGQRIDATWSQKIGGASPTYRRPPAPTTRRGTWSTRPTSTTTRPSASSRWTSTKTPNNISNAEAKKFVNTVTHTSGDGLTVAVTGPLAEDANNPSFSSTLLGVVLALIVLLLVFGSGYAAILPILSALLALGTAVGVIGLLSHALGMPSISPEVMLLIGLGVGVDYAALHRDETSPRARGRARCRVLHHQRGQHVGPRRPVRRHHRLHRPSGHVRHRRELPVRAGPGRGGRGGPHHGGGPHAAPGHARLHRAQGHEPQPEEEPGPQRPPHRGGGQQGLLAEVGRPGPAPPLGAGRRGPGRHCGPGYTVLLAPARFGRSGHRPGGHTDPGRFRHVFLQRLSDPGTRVPSWWSAWSSPTSTR